VEVVEGCVSTSSLVDRNVRHGEESREGDVGLWR
jgi:hypothetical protein